MGTDRGGVIGKRRREKCETNGSNRDGWRRASSTSFQFRTTEARRVQKNNNNKCTRLRIRANALFRVRFDNDDDFLRK